MEQWTCTAGLTFYSSKEADGKTCYARFGDAMHQSGDRSESAVVSDRAILLGPKATMVHARLKRELLKVLLTLHDDFKVAIITNVVTPSQDSVRCDNGVSVLILGPSNFPLPLSSLSSLSLFFFFSLL